VQNKVFCCHKHAKAMKKEREVKLDETYGEKKVNDPEQCIHCDEQPCVFIQIESHLCENNMICYGRGKYGKDHVIQAWIPVCGFYPLGGDKLLQVTLLMC
jgi:hypothetical protein